MAASSGNGGAAAAKQLRVLLPSSRDRLRIPDELADEIGAGEALIVSPVGGKGRAVWRVELGRGGGGPFLGRGWPEFAAAHGVAAAGWHWHLVLRHRGRGLLTIKAFDSSFCIKDLGAQQPAAAVQASVRSKENDCKPQFICMLSPASMEKMLIPAKFVQYFIAREELNSRMAVVFGPLGKVNSIKLEMDQLDVFFAGGWPQFLAFHDITESNALLLRYEGNMVFTVKVFEPNGCQRKPTHKDNIMQQSEQKIISTSPDLEKQQEALSVPIWKHKRQINLACSDVHKQKGSMPSLNEAELQRNSFYEIGQPSWIKKQINTDTLENHLALPIAFSDAIGLRKPSMITFKTTMTGSWQVRGVPCDNHSYLVVHGWRRFCEENNVKEGDICTFNVIKTTMWHVVITRSDMPKLPGTAFASSPEYTSSDDRSSSEEQEMSKGSITSSSKASSRKKTVYEIGPPAWITKKILNSNNRYFTLPTTFCGAIGLREACTITLKTSLSRTRSWQVHVHPYQNASFFRSGWNKFCRDNKIKEGDICTFNVVETMLWHVVVAHR
ncbi:unnamed protein product [Urochloa decumbens]|uniref:TF-B3 domain-containing protein n=1 Tax=Urochloa decumbens TaxID=240449 RepID=A0ABC9GUU5_9POAL